MASSATVWPLDGTNIAVLADCHIHPGGGPAFLESLFDALQGADLIVTLGDMGEAAGLDQLAEIAPVIGVRGQDDSDDPRTDQTLLLLTAGDLAIGCVFDAKTAGLATNSDPFAPVSDFAVAAERLFGRRIDALLLASTHRPEAASADGCLVFNPGSAVLPGEGSAPSFLKLSTAGGVLAGELASLG